MAIIEEPEIFDNRKEEICAKTFGTHSQNHPKIGRIWQQGDHLISGASMRFTSEIKFDDGMDQYRLTPAQVDQIATERGADAVYAF